MTENPYAAPLISTSSPAPSALRFRPARFLSAILCGCLAIYAINRLVSLVVFIKAGSLFGDPAMDDRTRGALVLVLRAAVALTNLISYLAAVVMFCFWIERAGKNARSLGALGMKFLPGWRAGWFFIPIANFWKPYQAVCEVYLASDPESAGTGWRRPGNVVPSRFGWWWTAWIGTIFLSWLQFNFRRSLDNDFHRLANYLTYLTEPMACATALLCVAVIRAMECRQAEKFARGADGHQN